jgi:hypothetical protein
VTDVARPRHHHDTDAHPHPRPAALGPEDRLRLIGDLGRTLSTILDPQELLERVTELVTHRFDYYSSIEICDGDELVVRSAHARDHGADPGPRGHRLRIGEQGISGRSSSPTSVTSRATSSSTRTCARRSRCRSWGGIA